MNLCQHMQITHIPKRVNETIGKANPRMGQVLDAERTKEMIDSSFIFKLVNL